MRWGLLGLLSCPRSAPPPVAPVPQAPVEDDAPRRTDVGAGAWSEPGGLCLEVPPSWEGTSGPPPHLLALRHAPSGVRLDLFAWSAAQQAPDPGDWELVFSDDGGYRTVPLLSPSSTATWATSEPQGPTRQTWSGQLGQRRVQVAATYPFDWSVAGRDLVEPLLEALCSTAEPEPGPGPPEEGGAGPLPSAPESATAAEAGDQQGEQQQRQP
ncbi:MAG TPA: hypothetical protein ENK18_18475 [Deltaproteobacteria bacterium]|nr:hypothetical protein [Deltaproteobacteria bacterium]